MKIVSISDDLMNLISENDREFMQKKGRPCLLVVRLRFRNRKRDFAIPFRSNIPPNVPRWQYFGLPPRPSTKQKHRHGIHYIKMFPVERRYLSRFRTSGNDYYAAIENIISQNKRQIVKDAQNYLDCYEREGRPKYAVDIDNVVKLLEIYD